MILITNVFALGFRCNADEFLEKYLKIRVYASPFSWVVIDLKSALVFIKIKFKGYTNAYYITRVRTPNNYKWYNKLYNGELFFHNFFPITVNKNIIENERCCIWLHHNLHDASIVRKLNARATHLLNVLENAAKSLLFIYLEKIQDFNNNNNSYFDITLLDDFTCHFLILIPLLNYNREPSIIYTSIERIKIIYFSSSLEKQVVDTKCHIDEWNKVTALVNSIYEFNIVKL